MKDCVIAAFPFKKHILCAVDSFDYIVRSGVLAARIKQQPIRPIPGPVGRTAFEKSYPLEPKAPLVVFFTGSKIFRFFHKIYADLTADDIGVINKRIFGIVSISAQRSRIGINRK